jgi:hypothetical protein
MRQKTFLLNLYGEYVPMSTIARAWLGILTITKESVIISTRITYHQAL